MAAASSRPTASQVELVLRKSTGTPPTDCNPTCKHEFGAVLGEILPEDLFEKGGSGAPGMLEEARKLFPVLNAIEAEEWAPAGIAAARLPNGAAAFVEGQPCPHVAFVLSGAIRVYKTGPDGRQLTLYYVTPGESCVLMWASVLAGARYNAQAVAAEDSYVLLVPVGVFQDWMQRYEPVRRFVYEAFAHRLAAVMLLVAEILIRHRSE